MTSPDMRDALNRAEEAVQRADDDPDLVVGAQVALDHLARIDTTGEEPHGPPVADLRDGTPPPDGVTPVLAARAMLRWRLVSAWIRRYQDGGAEASLARAITEQDAADLADRDLAAWITRTRLAPEPEARAALDRARRRGLRAIAALPGVTAPAPTEHLQRPVTSEISPSKYRELMDRARTVDADFTRHGDRTSNESLVQAAMFTSARVHAAGVWDPDAEQLLTTLTELLAANPGARDRMHEVFMPAAQVALSLARVMSRNLDPRFGSDHVAGEFDTLVARTEELIDRIEGPRAPIDTAAVPVAQMLHMLLGGMLLVRDDDDVADRGGQPRQSRAEQHLAKAPAGVRDVVDELLLAQRWRQGVYSGLLARADDAGADDDDPAAADIGARIQARYREMFEEFGGGFPEVLRLSEKAQRTRLLPDIDSALKRAGAVQAGLPSAHSMLGHLLAIIAHLQALRASVTHTPADAMAAVRAGTQALAHAVFEPVPPGLESVHPLTEALLTCVVADTRGAAHGEAESALSHALERRDLDECARLSATVGLGVARALRWAGGPDEGQRRSAREALDAAQEQLRVTVPSLESLRMGWGLLLFEAAMMALWGDPDAPAALQRIADHLEPVLRAHPDLRTQLDAMVDALTVPLANRPGMPDLTGGGGALGLIGILRQMSGTMRTLSGITPSGPFAGMFKDMLSDADTAAPLLAAALNATQGTGPALPTDMTAMMQAVMAAMHGRKEDFRQWYDQAHGTPATPAPPPAADADRAVDQALALLRDLLGEQPDVDTLPEARPPLSLAGRPDSDKLRAATGALSAARTDGVDPGHDHEAGDLLGIGLAELYWAGAADPDTLAEAVRLLEQARQHEARRLPTVRLVDRWEVQACCYAELGRVGRRRNALDDALGATRAALRELGRLVLLAPDTAAAMPLAARADRLVTRAIAWCLAVGRGGDAVAVAEAGRGLVLAAATVSGRVGEMLAALGQDDVAAAWRRGDAEGLARGLAAVSQEPEGISLLRVPSAQDVAMAVHATRLDAIVYLVPPARIDPVPPGALPRSVTGGHALVVTPGFAVEVVELPGLQSERSSEVARYLEALEVATAALDPEQPHPCGFRGSAAGGGWAAALDVLGAWAHAAVIRPLLTHLGTPAFGPVPERPRRLALIPLGELGAIPFAAAWTKDPLLPGRRRYAVHDLVLSQVASARLLGEVARRRPLPIRRRPVFLINAGKEFVCGKCAGEAIVEHMYPQAQVFGLICKDGQADAETILSVLPRRAREPLDGPGAEPEAGAASVLHLITHAVLPPGRGGDPLTGTRLQVTEEKPNGGGDAPPSVGQDDSAWLSLGRILDHARGADPDTPSGLVICDACVTDVTVSHPDESLSLATAFLAAGATGVIGTRWLVDDDAAGLLAYLLHHYLKDGALPAEALRSAQLWMLSRRREPIPGLPAQLADERTPGRHAEPASWAAYVHHGT